MVCVTEDESVVCYVRKESSNNEPIENDNELNMRTTDTVGHLFQEVSKKYDVNDHSFELFYCKYGGIDVPLSDSKTKTLKEMGITSEQEAWHRFTIREFDVCNGTCTFETDYPDDLLLGASASPTAIEGPQNLAQISEDPLQINVLVRQDSAPYVGLVNQAMTCYLNSLLQALYMTPEFRNALYNWEFKGSDPSTSIPYQLQTLFLNLQTSSKSAVETIELTHSFGWDLREAWQQHDIQELCRVMFDALEQTFKDTDQADLINRLYQGKMTDYVKCLECKTEKTREDTFLDIPLPVRPFGSNVAYGSVEEALRAFVQPETLDGNNQYFCDKCNKKCDAHKGLKFTKIPYLLTLHLKRFDFDYSTMHRIKLNDKVTFPETLDLNSFVSSTLQEESESCEEITVVKCDDSSTTDSGSALDDESCQGTDMTAMTRSTGPTADECQEDDEGIDMSTGNENEKNRRHSERKGPYTYELFSIMIHSGSASGGHYYAYIKDFKKNKWFCFDDQTVSRITYDDIHKTYGGGPQRSYYSGAFSSSTNAYMLMYRQIDKERNANATTSEEFPPHIKKLLQSLQEQEASEKYNRYRDGVLCSLKLYYIHPTQHQMLEKKLFLLKDYTLTEATQEAYRKIKLENIVPIEHCRLVSYNKMQNTIDCSFEGREEESINDIMNSLKLHTDFLLEIRNKDAQFVEYKPGGVNIKVYIVNIESEDIDGPFLVRGYETQTWSEFKGVLGKTLDLNEQTMKIYIEPYSCGVSESFLLKRDDIELRCYASQVCPLKIYVMDTVDEDPEKPLVMEKFNKIINKFIHLVSFEVVLPVNDKWTLEVLSIPPLDVNQNCCDKVDNGSGEPTAAPGTSPKLPRASPSVQNGPSTGQNVFIEPEDMVMGHSDQSNSEDSSLSDSDRTLVGEAPDGLFVHLFSASNSPVASDQHLSSPEDLQSVFLEESPEDEGDSSKRESYYFKVVEVPTEPSEHVGKTLKVLVDKRSSLLKFKKEMEPHVGVSMEYFKVFKQDIEWNRLTDTFVSIRDGEKLVIKLGKVPKDNEYPGKLYQLVLNSPEPIKFLREWVVAKGETVGHAKRAILDALKLDIPMNRCRLRKKSWKHPNKVYLDDQKFSDDIYLYANWEMFLQELPEPEVVQTSSQVLLFVRRWSPSTLELQPFQEVLLEGMTVTEFKDKLSEISGIPADHVEFAMLKGAFPYDVSVLVVHKDLEWNPDVTNLTSWPLQVNDDGNAFVYRDSREQLKQLTTEERKEIINAESAHVSRYGKSMVFSPRKERALKIYLDQPQATNSN